MINYQLSEENISRLTSRRNMLCTCDQTGKVIAFLSGTDFSSHPSLQGLFRKKDLHEVFEWPPYRDLNDIPADYNGYRLRDPITVFYFLERFYSTLPVVGLRIVRLSPDRFLAVILIAELVPNYFPEQNSGFFLVDQGDRVVGFSQSFYSHFKTLFESPEKMLLTPTARLMDPGLASIQKILAERTIFSPPDGLMTAYEKNFSEERLSGEETLVGSQRAESAGSGLRWEALGEQSSYLRVRPSFRLHEEELTVEAEVTVVTGRPPVFILSPEPPEGQDPDFEGYLVGQHGLQNGFLVKKDGYILHYTGDTGEGAIPAGSRVRLKLHKAGRTFCYFLDDNLVFSYCDMDVHVYPPVHVSLALRSGCACLLHGLRVRHARQGRGGEGGEGIPAVRLATSPDEFYRLTRFHNHSLNAHYPNVKGYLLQNITDIQHQVVQLDEKYRRQVENGRRLESMLKSIQERDQPFIGSHPAILKLKEKARTIAASNATVLIQGDTGTGKEVMAAYIHANSPYANGPFVKVDCSTLPKSLMESELFGHEKGAFTGALVQKGGKLEQANRGTLFLDEVGNLTLETQAKLLQFLQDFRITRVGGTRVIPLDLRVIAASNLPLNSLLRSGLFREDLYYRLCVIVIDIPPLSARKEDLPDLCYYFLRLFSEQAGKTVRRISPQAMKKLYAYSWPGNIRELKNAMQQAVLFCEGEEITGDLIGIEPAKGEPGREGRAPGADDAEREHFHCLRGLTKNDLSGLLAKHNGNIAALARALRVSRSALYYQLKNKRLDPPAFRDPHH